MPQRVRTASLRLAHGWRLVRTPNLSDELVSGSLRPAVRAVPSGMAARLGFCRILAPPLLEPPAASRWTATRTELEISLAAAEVDGHDLAMELLVCLGQALWDRLLPGEKHAYWTLLSNEVAAGVDSEIDEEALAAKRRLFASRSHARDNTLIEEYGRASLSGTTAEFVHALWHDVTIREGPEHLPPEPLRRRLELIARWFPPDRGHRLFPPRSRGRLMPQP